MTVGKAVNAAYNGPTLDHDELIGFIDDRNREDRQRSSSAGETRQKIGEYLEETGMNGKALGFCRQILKINDKDDGQHKAMDVIMSLNKALPMIEAHVRGQGTTEMEFDTDPIETESEDEFVNDAHARGKAAYHANITIDGNPFDQDKESVKFGLWNSGWNEAWSEDSTGESEDDLDDETVEAIGAEMDADLEETDNVVQPFSGDAA